MAALLLAVALGRAATTDPRVAFIGVWDRSEPLIDQAARELGIGVAFYRAQDLTPDSTARKTLDRCQVVYILNLESGEAMALSKWLAGRSNHNQKILPLDHRGSHVELEKAGLLTDDPEVPRYWRANGPMNVRRLLQYTMVHYLGGSGKVEPPILVPDYGYYEPGHEDPFETFAALRQFKAAAGRWKERAPVAALLIQQSFWVTHDTKVVDAQIRALEAHGMNAVVIFGDTQAMVESLIHDARPDLLIEDRHGAMWDSRRVLESLDVPYLRPISMLASTIDEWKRNPQGLAHRDVGNFMTLQESWGTLEPVVVGGMHVNISGFRLHDPVPDGVERFAARAASWLNLRIKPNSEKRLAIVYYNKGLGRDDLMRGSPTGGFLDAPESAVRFLPRLQQRGYRLDRLPKDASELIGWIRQGGRNIGPWDQGELEEMVRSGKPVLIPVRQYLSWFHKKLSPANQEAVVRRFGPPPGRLMVVERRGEKFIVIPRIDLGNVILVPQPERGEKQDEKLLHSRDVPPPHNYLAFYWWLQEGYHADAAIHWGTHGTLELLPGKEAGMTRDDWSDICAGNMPVVDLWIMDNLAEATLARRRSYAHLVDHMVPPAVSAGLEGAHNALQSDVDKFAALEPGLLKEEYRKRVTEGAAREGISQKLGMQAAKLLGDAEIARVAAFVHEVSEARTPLTLHVLGKPPEEKYFHPYLVSVLGHQFLDHIAEAWPPPGSESGAARRAWLERRGAEFLKTNLDHSAEGLVPDLVKDLDMARQVRAHLLAADDEIVGLLRALEGRYVQPGPGPEPIRNPASIPAGRNLYALNPEEIPTRPAWEVGMRLVDELLKRKHPRKVGIDLSGMDTMRDFGVTESEALYLMGVRPVWDRNGLAIDVEPIPRSELKRARVDVFCAMGGQYKENFPTRVKLLDKAVRLVSALEEEDNLVRAGTLHNEKALEAKGYSREQARDLANARIFGTKPGNMSGTNILYLVPRSGVWEKDAEVADVYVDSMSYAYTGDVWGQKVQGVYEQAIQGTDTVVRVWASNMTSQLSNHHAYEYLGGLSMAVAKFTGRQPEAFIADVRDPNGARLREFGEVLATNMETELLNQAWIEGMKEHGYAGAGHAAELVKNTFGWSVTRKGSVSDAQWSDVYAVYVQDRYHLQVREWMEKVNPHALEEIAATMIEAARKGTWGADRAQVEQLTALYARLVVKHGDSGGLVSGGNKHLEEYVSGVLEAKGTAPGKALAKRMAESLGKSAGAVPPAPAHAPTAAPASQPRIVGRRLERIAEQVPRAPASPFSPAVRNLYLLIVAFALSLLSYGFAVRRGAI